MPFLTHLKKKKIKKILVATLIRSVEFRVPTAFAWVVVTVPIKNTISRECDSITDFTNTHEKYKT